MCSHEARSPNRVNCYIGPFLVPLTIQGDDFIQRESAPVMPAAILAGPKQSAVVSKYCSGAATLANVGRDGIGGVRCPLSGERACRKQPQLNAVTSRFLQ